MIINNPQDLTPLLAAMREGLQADMTALTQGVEQSNNTLSQTMQSSNQDVIDDIAALSVVNGEISTEVQAINLHTSTELDEAILTLSSKSLIKAVYRGKSSYRRSSYFITVSIPEIDPNKSQLRLLGSIPYPSTIELVSSTQIKISGHYIPNSTDSVYVSWEIVEYA